MLDFAEQTGSGILIAVWSFLLTCVTCNIQIHYTSIHTPQHRDICNYTSHNNIFDTSYTCILSTSIHPYRRTKRKHVCYYAELTAHLSDKHSNINEELPSSFDKVIPTRTVFKSTRRARNRGSTHSIQSVIYPKARIVMYGTYFTITLLCC